MANLIWWNWRTWWTYLMTLLRWLFFLLRFLTVTLTVLLFLLTLVFFLQWFSLHYEILIVLLSQFQLPFLQTQKCMTRFITWLMTTLELIGTVFVIIWEMFHGRISLNSVLLLLLVNFVSRFWLESMYIYLVVSINSSLTHLHSFQLLVLLP